MQVDQLIEIGSNDWVAALVQCREMVESGVSIKTSKGMPQIILEPIDMVLFTHTIKLLYIISYIELSMNNIGSHVCIDHNFQTLIKNIKLMYPKSNDFMVFKTEEPHWSWPLQIEKHWHDNHVPVATDQLKCELLFGTEVTQDHHHQEGMPA